MTLAAIAILAIVAGDTTDNDKQRYRRTELLTYLSCALYCPANTEDDRNMYNLTIYLFSYNINYLKIVNELTIDNCECINGYYY